MFMNDEKDERFIRAMEALAEAEVEKINRKNRMLGLMVILVPIATGAWGIPLAVTLWRAATGN